MTTQEQESEVKRIGYKLTIRAINLIVHNKFIRRRVAAALDMSDRTVWDILHSNRPNNTLTLSASVDAITREVGLEAGEILESVEL